MLLYQFWARLVKGSGSRVHDLGLIMNFFITSPAHPSEGRSSTTMASPLIQNEMNRRADVVRRHYVDLNRILGNFPEVLSSVTMRCFQDSLIDMNTKTAITSSNGQNGSSILLDHIHTKLEQSEDYLPLVLSIFREEVSLEDVVSRMESFVAENVQAMETVSEQTG